MPSDLIDELSKVAPRKPTLTEWITSLPQDEREALDSYLLDPLVPIERLLPVIRSRAQCTRDSLSAWREKHGTR